MFQQFPEENRIIADKTTLSADLKLQLMRTHPGTFLYSISVRITWFMPGEIPIVKSLLFLSFAMSYKVNNCTISRMLLTEAILVIMEYVMNIEKVNESFMFNSLT